MGSQRPCPSGLLGVNFNERFTWINHREVRSLGAKWIRGFIDMHQTSPDLEQDPNIKALFRAINAGFKIILSLKWNYSDLDFPSPSNCIAELQRLETLLRLVMGKVDILVIGNEPFIEAKQDQTDERLNVFYETLAMAVIKFRQTHGHFSTRLYMGALNRLDLPAKRTPAIERMLGFIASRPELEGVDIHLHMPTFPGHKAMLDYVLPRIRPDQTFIATEFSMIWHWKRHMNDVTQSKAFPPGTKVYQAINAAIENPIPYEQWEDFLRHEPWYMECEHFISHAMRLYRSTGRLEIATYCMCPMRNRKKPLAPGDNPWMMNSLIAPSMVQLKPDGMRHENFPWAAEFRQMLKEGRHEQG